MQLTKAEHLTARPCFTRRKRLLILILVVALTDFLVFKHGPGLNLFLVSVLLTAAVLLAAARSPSPRAAVAYLAFSSFAAAPLLEAPSLSGLIISMVAVVLVALAASRLLPKRFTAIPFVVLRFMPVIPIRLAETWSQYSVSHPGQSIFGMTLRSLSGWMFPLGMALVFLLLLSAGNPLIEMGLHNIDLRFLLNLLDVGRLVFWLSAAVFIWALIRPRLIRRCRRRPMQEPADSSPARRFLNHTVLVRSLWLFNLLFAAQTLLDVMYLWGGAELPAGMSHAEYAHRGAYLLVATALLAAAFVLIAMRRGGPGDLSRLIRTLVISWIIQNVLLCLSSILRLDLYVETYSLTGLRIAAGIWMGLVAAGLVFILLRIEQRRSNQWLISMNFLTLAVVLYLCAFLDFSGIIARFNVENSMRPDHQGEPLDIEYLSSLGPSAIPALDLYMSATIDTTMRQMANEARLWLAMSVERGSSDWRGWSYREHRMKNYLRATALIER